MNTENELYELYAEWRSLTEAEGQAIRHGQWQQVSRQQCLKQALQRKIIQAGETWQAAWSKPEDGRMAYDHQFRPILAELISLESRNHALLCAQRQNTGTELAGLGQSTRRLHGLHRAYGRAHTGRWQAYS